MYRRNNSFWKDFLGNLLPCLHLGVALVLFVTTFVSAVVGVLGTLFTLNPLWLVCLVYTVFAGTLWKTMVDRAEY